MATLIDRIRTIRKELQYTQDLMAHELGISQTTYSYLENNDEKSLTIGRLSKIAAVFKLSLAELVRGTSEVQIECLVLNQQNGHTNGLIVESADHQLQNAKTIGDRIRYLREKQMLRQTDIASRMGISQKTYSMLESADDDAQKIGRLKHIALCLSLADWSELLTSGPHISIKTVSENQYGVYAFGAGRAIHQRMQESQKSNQTF